MGRFFRKAQTIFGARVKNGLFIKKKVYLEKNASKARALPFKRQPHKMIENTQKIRRLLPANSLSVFDHFVGFALKGLIEVKRLTFLKLLY